MADLERTKIKVGFIPIIDCAAIVLAEELGAYERQGLEVEIRREVSWANVRDKLALGVLDASHILAPLPLGAATQVNFFVSSWTSGSVAFGVSEFDF